MMTKKKTNNDHQALLFKQCSSLQHTCITQPYGGTINNEQQGLLSNKRCHDSGFFLKENAKSYSACFEKKKQNKNMASW